MSRNLKSSKKLMSSTFPLQCGYFYLNDFKHAEKEAQKIKDFRWATIPKRQYDPKNVSFNFTSMVRISKFEHEEADFDDLFASVEGFSQVKHLEKLKFGAKGMEEFLRFKNNKLLKIPLEQLRTTPLQHEEYREEKNTETEQEKENTGKKAGDSSEMDIDDHSKLLKEWRQFNQHIRGQKDSQNAYTV